MQEKVLTFHPKPARRVILEMHCWEDKKVRSFVEKNGAVRALGILYLLTWAPLTLLAIGFENTLPDIATHIRFLFSLPLLLWSFPVMVRKQNWVLRQFQESGIIRREDDDDLRRIIDADDRLMNSDISRAIIMGLAYLSAIWMYLGLQRPIQEWGSFDAPAGLYFHLLLQPLYNYVVLRLVFHLLLRFHVCFRVARLDLDLHPAHGDGLGGMGFLSSTLVAFSVPAFALSSSSAAGAANLVLHRLVTLEGLQVLVSAYAFLLILLLVMPLLLFIPALLRARERAMGSFGRLASVQSGDFARDWLARAEERTDSLEVGDFSAITDFGSEVSRVHSMRLIPVKPRDVVILLFAIAVPFSFVFSIEMSWKAILSGLLGLLH